MRVSQNHQLYWRMNLRITAVLLFIWFYACCMNKLDIEHGVAEEE